MKKLTKEVIKQKFEKEGEGKLSDLRLDMQKMKVEIIANANVNEKISEQRTPDIKRMTIDTK